MTAVVRRLQLAALLYETAVRTSLLNLLTLMRQLAAVPLPVTSTVARSQTS